MVADSVKEYMLIALLRVVHSEFSSEALFTFGAN
jgi:hypothetical protein